MFKKIAILALFAGFSLAAHATVTVGGNGVSNLVLSDSGTPLAAGDLVRLGYFSSTANLGTDNSFSDLNAIFTPIGEGIADAGTLTESGNSGNTLDINNFSSTPGAFYGSYGNVSSTYLPTGVQLYMWVLDTTSTNNVTQWAILDAPSWTFPADPGGVTMSLSSASISVIRGSTVVMNGTTDYELSAIPVPEPATDALMAGTIVAAGTFLWRRR